MGDAHVPVIDADAEVVGRRAVGAGDDEVVQFLVGDRDAPLHLIVPRHHAIQRIAEADDRLHAFRRRRQRLAGRRAPAAVIARLFIVGTLALAQRVEFFRRGVAAIGVALLQHLRDHRLVTVHALHLVEGAFVMAEIQPLHTVENGLHRFRRRARDVGVLDAQDELAAVTARVGPRKQRGTGATDVQITGRAGGKAGADNLGHDDADSNVSLQL